MISAKKVEPSFHPIEQNLGQLFHSDVTFGPLSTGAVVPGAALPYQGIEKMHNV